MLTGSRSYARLSITDAAVSQLARSCARLRYIDLACMLSDVDSNLYLIDVASGCPLLTNVSVFELAHLSRLKRIGLVRVTAITDEAVIALMERKTLERIHLSYCEHLSIEAINLLLQSLKNLTHLSLTGVPAFRRSDLQAFCRPPPTVRTLLIVVGGC